MRPRALIAVLASSAVLAGCGHPHDPVPVVPVGPQVAGLALQLTRVGPEAVQLDWSYDPAAYAYTVTRDGYPLATASANQLIDASVLIGGRYCWQVTGLSPGGRVVSYSSTGCMTIF